MSESETSPAMSMCGYLLAIAMLCDTQLLDPGVDETGRALLVKVRAVRRMALDALKAAD